MADPDTQETLSFRSHPQYFAVGGGALGIAAYLGWVYGQAQDATVLAMSLICLGLAVWHGQWWGARLTLSRQNLTWRRALRRPLVVQPDEIHALRKVGRLTQSLLLEYGDPEVPSALWLPKMTRQDALLAQLRARVAAAQEPGAAQR